MKIIDVAFFAYAVSDMKTARAFYEGVLGFTPNSEFDVSDDAHWVEYDIGTATLGIGCAPGMFDPSPKGASAALEVDDFDAAVEAMKAKQVPVVMGPHDFPTCRMIVIADPDGNRITLHKRKTRG
jgi:predicted enzyme related to lactoylglutathione lyase